MSMYTYAMIQKMYWDDEEYFAYCTRESVDRIGKVVTSLKWDRLLIENLLLAT